MDNTKSPDKKSGGFEFFKSPDTLRNEGAEAEKRRTIERFLPTINEALKRICELEVNHRLNLSDADHREITARYDFIGAFLSGFRLTVESRSDVGRFVKETIYSERNTFDKWENLTPEKGELEDGDLIEIVQFPVRQVFPDKVPVTYQEAKVKILRKASAK